MKILITGSEGFVGKALSKKLNQLGHTVLGIDSLNGYNILSWEDISKIPEFDLAYHLAAQSFVPHSYERPRDFYNTNCVGTLNILELCRLYKARMVYLSSYIYGKPDYLPIDEKHPVRPFNPYAQTKYISEKLCQGYNRDFNLPVFIIRPFNLYGPGQNPNFLIPSIASQLNNSEIIIKDGRPKRDFVFIDDFTALLSKIPEKDFSYNVVNAASGTSYSVTDVAEMLVNIAGTQCSLKICGSDRPMEIPDTLGSYAEAEKLLGWVPETNFKEGLRAVFSNLIQTSTR